ncbi:uncharacterized protein LOC113312692 [Papaver somniferum]|uniref:uncharacterized protein LOC113312692 n=1 Tax=Papaver somniferum TaxID=3469 RepID=UPI000E703572|nr:uncharacterized protein LOC113312692 [Papaver somniferum]
MRNNPNIKVAEFLKNGEWVIPPAFSNFFGSNELLVVENHGYRIICTDSATSRGNPGPAGFGFIGRDMEGEVIGAATGRLGIATNFLAEVMAVLSAGEWAISKKIFNVCFKTDLSAAITDFKTGKLPWLAITRWKNICTKLQWSFTHSFREVNFSADSLARRGASMNKG